MMIDCIFASSSHLLPCDIDICLSTKMPSVLQTHLFHWLHWGECFDWLHLLSVCALFCPDQMQDRIRLPQVFFSQKISIPSDQQNLTNLGSGSMRNGWDQETRPGIVPDHLQALRESLSFSKPQFPPL